mgnify:CR=1 FL=1
MTTETRTPGTVDCTGCGKSIWRWAGDPCWDCVKARARAATTGGRCKCGNKRKEGAPIVAYRINGRDGRTFTKCGRCLGTVRQWN